MNVHIPQPPGPQANSDDGDRARTSLKVIGIGTIAALISALLFWYGTNFANRLTQIEQSWTKYNREAVESESKLNQIEVNLGYGGFIHHYKNYLLRRDASLIPKIEHRLEQTYAAIISYRLNDPAPQSLAALDAVKAVVDQYAVMFQRIKQLHSEGKNSTQIDRQVKVNDKPAVEALALLHERLRLRSEQQNTDTTRMLNDSLATMYWGLAFIPMIIAIAFIITRFMRQTLRANHQLAATSRYLTDLFEAAPDAMLLINKQGRIMNVNNRTSELFGYRRDDLLNMEVERLIPEQFRQTHRGARAHAFVTEPNGPLMRGADFYIQTHDGKQVPVDISLSFTQLNGERHAITILRDISLQKKIAADMQRSESMLRRAQKIAQMGSWDWDIKTNTLKWSDEIYRIFGLEPESFDASYDTFLQHIHPDDRDLVVDAVNAAVVYDESYSIEHRIIRADNSERIVLERGDVFRDDAGKAYNMVGTLRDVTEQRRAELALRIADNVFNNTAEAIMVCDAELNIIRINHAFSETTGYTSAEVMGQVPRQLLKSDEHDDSFYETLWSSLNTTGNWRGEILDRRKDGKLYPSWHNISTVRDGHNKIIQYLSIFSDISIQKQNQERIQNLAHFDQLTGLPNRTLFNDRLQHAISRAQRYETKLALMFIDLDGFKNINDTLGHQAGDQMLQEAAQRLCDCVRGDDTVARLGGDEFIIIFEDLQQIEDAGKVADNIILSLRQEVDIEGHKVAVGGSIGISIYPEHGYYSEDLVKHADMAMYQAKKNGKNRYQFYNG